MTHSYSKLLYHLIWSTKNREQHISVDIKNRLFGYMRTVINDKKQYLYIINGMPEHVHLLVSLSASICVSDLLNIAKHLQLNGCNQIRSITKNFHGKRASLPIQLVIPRCNL